MSNNMSNEKQILRVIYVAYIIVCVFIAIKSFNLAIVFAFIGSALFLKKFTLLEYIAVSCILLVKTQYERIYSSNDLASFVAAYNGISDGVSAYDRFSGIEIGLPSIFMFFSQIFPVIEVNVMALCFLIAFLIVFFPIVSFFRDKPFVAFSILMLVDVNLVVHLFRQSFASALIISAIIIMINLKKRYFSGLFLSAISILFHSTMVVFIPMVYFFLNISAGRLKFLLLTIGGFSLMFISLSLVDSLLKSMHTIPILTKVYTQGIFHGDEGFRPIAVVSYISLFFIKDDNAFIRVFIGFAIISMIFYHIPILSTRVGLVSSSILTGLPIGILLYNFKLFFVRIQRAKTS